MRVRAIHPTQATACTPSLQAPLTSDRRLRPSSATAVRCGHDPAEDRSARQMVVAGRTGHLLFEVLVARLAKSLSTIADAAVRMSAPKEVQSVPSQSFLDACRRASFWQRTSKKIGDSDRITRRKQEVEKDRAARTPWSPGS